MGKKNSEKNLGRSLIKNRFGTKNSRNYGDSYLHSAEMQDELNLLNLHSVTEESSFQEFLATAELAGAEFQAEKLNVKVVNSKSGLGLPTEKEREEILKAQEENKGLLRIPRRPKWDRSMTAEELQTEEKKEFLEWRRKLAMLQETKGLYLTPYEKNLEFWRQLWRVIERSDIVVQIVDARNPLLFRCEDLENYVKEVNPNKINMILINKADFLTEKQRITWAEYFSNANIRVAFFSAISNDNLEKVDEDQTQEDLDSTLNLTAVGKSNSDSVNDSRDIETSKVVDSKSLENLISQEVNKNVNSTKIENSSNILNRDELISLFKKIYPMENCVNNITSVGFVGYPNVGKSSTINTLLTQKKVSVSATPGKTKHFQSLYIDKHLLLNDCPGLVMPSFVSTKAEMILNGILPINQMRDHVSPINLLATLIPKNIIENLYGIIIPLPAEGEDPNRSPTSEEILNAHGVNRGFMTQNGQPDNSRSARYILKDFVSGKLLYCVAPPGQSQEEFHTFSLSKRKIVPNAEPLMVNSNQTEISSLQSDQLDKTFFNNMNVHIKGKNNVLQKVSNLSISVSTPSLNSIDKPWKKINKHCNKKKKEKSRRLYAHLDKV